MRMTKAAQARLLAQVKTALAVGRVAVIAGYVASGSLIVIGISRSDERTQMWGLLLLTMLLGGESVLSHVAWLGAKLKAQDAEARMEGAMRYLREMGAMAEDTDWRRVVAAAGIALERTRSEMGPAWADTLGGKERRLDA